MMATEDHDFVEAVIQKAARAIAPPTSLKQNMRDRLVVTNKESGNVGSAQRYRWRLAAASFAVLATTAMFMWPTSLTLAQVQSAVASMEWVHLKYDDGRERWISPTRGIFAAVDPKNKFLVFANSVEGFSQYYTEREFDPSYIYENSRPARRPELGDIWHAVVGHVEKQSSQPLTDRSTHEVKRATEMIDGKLLIRFDTIFIDALGQRRLIEQLWADPERALPVKIRSRFPSSQQSKNAPEFSSGVYEFPKTGPATIYDLGAPREVSIVKFKEEMSPEVAELVNRVRGARDRFLKCYRIVAWGEKPGDNVSVLHWNGRPTLNVTPEGAQWLNFADVRIRQETFFTLGPEHPAYHLAMPATGDEVLNWTATQTPVNLCLADGKRFYLQSGPFPPMFTGAGPVTLSVHRAIGRPLFPNFPWADDLFWGPGSIAASDTELLPASAEAPTGTLGVRFNLGDVERNDYYVDPERDYICVKQTTWRRTEDGQWRRDRETMMGDFVQLATGQWIATTRQTYQSGDPVHGISPSTNRWRIQIEPLTPDEIPAQIFDGDLLLNKANTLKAKIETF